MCGIAGFCNYERNYRQQAPLWEHILVEMREAIAHRGKDQTGEYLGEHIGLSHTRLSIRDLALGAQPIVRRQREKEYIIVYNGEIYNADELRRELSRAGYTFETTTDTEVILYGYMKDGIDFVKQLNGIFAFAIWDGARGRLVLYRDRAGVKPLFYCVKNGTLVFGSEIKALFQYPEITPEADANSFREIFGVGPARTSGNGVFKGIFELKPGCFGIFSQDGWKEEPYWKLEGKEHKDDYQTTVETVSYLVRDAVTRQMVSDVPVCSFLSGGIDSSIVTAVAARYLEQEGKTLNTFSFDFKGNDKFFQSNSFQPEQDRPYVDKMLKAYRLNHTYLVCDEAELADLLLTSVAAKDLPGMADVDASLLYFCKLVKQHNKVALTGECADEIFGGYPWFYREDLLNANGFPWSSNMETRTMLLKPEVAEVLALPEYAAARYEDTLKEVPRLDGESPESARRREISYLNMRWFMQTLLDRMDRASMYSGLEARVPFADHRIIEYLYNVPWEMKYQDGVEKALLRDACKDLLPPELLNRKKSPYPKTYNPNYERLLAQRFETIIGDVNAPVMALLDKNMAGEFLKAPAEYGKPWFGQLMAAPQLMAYLIQVNEWMKRFHIAG